MLRPWWFPEYSPGQQIVFDEIVKIIEKNYKQFWYTHIHTPAVEANKVLLAKNWEDAGKQIFGLYGLAQWSEDLKDYSLHFDLTVPFARYVIDRENELTFPFKRYQIQPAWRGERQQKWRFREFFQCDMDAIWKAEDKDDYLFYDAETLLDLSKTLNEIVEFGKINDKAIVNINNKKVIIWLLKYLFKTDDLVYKVSNLIDKFLKIWEENFILSLKDLGIKDKEIQKLLEFIKSDVSAKNLKKFKDFVPDATFNQWIDELNRVVELLEKFSSAFNTQINYQINFQTVRGLDYYTWTVFEFYFANDLDLGCICGWGRYDNLTSYIDAKKHYSWVGWSIWISRILNKILENKNFKADQKTISDYLFLNFPETFDQVLKLAAQFIREWKNIEIYPTADKIAKQFSFADKKWIPNVVIFGEWEKSKWIYKIKNMKTWEEKEEKLDSK